MRIDATNLVPGANVEPAAAPVKPKEHVSAPKDEVVHKQVNLDSTNVVVEMQKGNVLVYKFIDEASGQLIQQIPSEQMLNFSDAVAAALPAIARNEK